jgi:hypothetical protein
MSRGPSGRLVVELEPSLKHQLYSTLALDGLTFKDWLTDQAERYITEHKQPRLFANEPPTPPYTKIRPKKLGGS